MLIQTNLSQVTSSFSDIYVFLITSSDVFEVGAAFLKQILSFGIQFSDRIIKFEVFKIFFASPDLGMKS